MVWSCVNFEFSFEITFGHGGNLFFQTTTAHSQALCTMPRGRSNGHRALAHLLAALSIATPRQAKEPTFPPATNLIL